MTITRALPADAGCWIDGHWGQYGVARMVEIAAAHGYDNSPDVPMPQDGARIVLLSTLKLAECAHPGMSLLTDEQDEELDDACDSVVDWMNENVAPDGFSFHWFDGEFFLNSHEDWAEAYGETDEEDPYKSVHADWID